MKGDRIINRLADKWCVNRSFLKDFYFLIIQDVRFTDGKQIYYKKVATHLGKEYRLDVNERQIRYLIKQMRRKTR